MKNEITYIKCYLYSSAVKDSDCTISQIVKKAVLSSFYEVAAGSVCLDIIRSSFILTEMEKQYKVIFENDVPEKVILSCSRLVQFERLINVSVVYLHVLKE